MKKAFLLVLALALSTRVAHATSALQITDIGISADSVAIANIHGFSKSPSSVFTNPSNLYSSTGNSFSYFNASLNDAMVQYHNLAFSQNLSKNSGFAFGVMQVQTDPHSETGLDQFDEIVEVSTFSYTNSLIKAAYYQEWNSIAYSIGLSYYFSEFYGLTSNGFNADVGFVLLPKDKNSLTTAITVRNILPGLQLNYSDGTYEALPLQAYFSFKQPISNFEIFGQAQYQEGKEQMLKAIGVSYIILDSLKLHAGRREYFALQEIESSTVYGASIELFNFGMHYAMEPYSFASKETKNYMSINFTF